jgi:hypothetical protein
MKRLSRGILPVVILAVSACGSPQATTVTDSASPEMLLAIIDTRSPSAASGVVKQYASQLDHP